MEVPRPTSSINTRLFSVALCRMLAVSVISTIKGRVTASPDRPPHPQSAVDRANLNLLRWNVAADVGEQRDKGLSGAYGYFYRPCWGR